MYSVDDGAYSTSIPTGTAAKTYTVKYKVQGDDNVYDTTPVDITVSIGQAAPTVTAPTATAITYGDTLAQSTLTTGWTWEDDTIKPEVNNSGFKAYITVTDYANYDYRNLEGFEYDETEHKLSCIVSVTVNKATPSVTPPTATAITYGQALSVSELSDANWSWVDGSVIPSVINSGYPAKVTVDDLHYDYSNDESYDSDTHTVTRTIAVSVNKATPTITVTASPTSDIAGKTITVSDEAVNPNNSTLTDVPAPTLTYKVGDDGTETEFTGSFVIPEGTAGNTIITITATTAGNSGYETGTNTAIVTVDECLHTDKTEVWEKDSTGHWHICNYCGAEVDKEEHTEDSGTVTLEPTETTEGIKIFKCTKCDYVIRTEPISVLEHTHSLAAEYSSDATGHWYACSDCNEQVDFEPHTEDSGTVTTEPTETTEGIKTFKCVKCENVMRTETISPITPEHTHSYGTEWKTDSTSHWHECSCGDKADIGQHISNGGVVTVQPTETSTGLRVYSCSVCGYVLRTETIPATGYNGYPSYPTYPTYPTYVPPIIATSSVFTAVSEIETEVNVSTVTLKWDKIKNADKYYVYLCKDGKYVRVKTTTDTSVTLMGLNNGETYKYLVRYTINGKLSPTNYSGDVTVKVYYKPIPKPTATKNSIKLTWEAVPEAEKYAIYKYVDGKAVKLTETNKLSVKIGKLTPDTEYKYIVRAYVDGKWTTMVRSDIVTVKTKAE